MSILDTTFRRIRSHHRTPSSRTISISPLNPPHSSSNPSYYAPTNEAMEEEPPKKRGRKFSSLPPSVSPIPSIPSFRSMSSLPNPQANSYSERIQRSRDVQRAFRARRAAHLANLQNRNQWLEEHKSRQLEQNLFTTEKREEQQDVYRGSSGKRTPRHNVEKNYNYLSNCSSRQINQL